MSVGFETLSVACQKMWNELHDGCDDNRDERFHKLRFSVSTALRSLFSDVRLQEIPFISHKSTPNQYVLLAHWLHKNAAVFTFFFRSEAISFFVWRSVNSSQAIIIIIFAPNEYFCTNQNTVCVLSVAGEQTWNSIDSHNCTAWCTCNFSTWTFHSVTTAAAAAMAAAVAVIVLDACGLSFFRL